MVWPISLPLFLFLSYIAPYISPKKCQGDSFEKMKTKVDPLFSKEKAMKTVSPVLTPMQDQQLAEIKTHVQSLFHEKAEQWARLTGFVQRRSEISGSAFAQTLVFGFL